MSLWLETEADGNLRVTGGPSGHSRRGSYVACPLFLLSQGRQSPSVTLDSALAIGEGQWQCSQERGHLSRLGGPGRPLNPALAGHRKVLPSRAEPA